MAKQFNMDDFIKSCGEPHLACALLLDVSGSMAGDAINSLNNSIKQFKYNVSDDPVARNRVDVALITFGSEVKVVSDFMPVTEMPVPVLRAGGRTDMAAGIDKAVDMVKERTGLYHNLGTPCHKPWIFMITDGLSTSSESAMMQAAQKIKMAESKGSNGHLSFWALDTGDYDQDELFSLTKRVIELRNQDFRGVFDWLSESMAVISQSRPGEDVEFGTLPENVRKAERGRRIDEDWY